MTDNIGGFAPLSDEVIEQALTYSILPDPTIITNVRLKMTPDPLGGPNTVIQLTSHNADGSLRPMGKPVLYPIHEDSLIRMSEEGHSIFAGIGWRSLLNGAVALKPHVWFVEVNDRRIIEIPWHEAFPDPVPVPAMPWYREARWRIRNWRAYRHRIVDRAAHRLGYQHIGECDCDG